MTDYSVNCVLKSVTRTCGEGPFWQDATKTLFFVSTMDGEVHLWSEPNNHHDKIQVGQHPDDVVSFVIPCERGGFLASVNRSIVHCDWSGGQLQRRTLHEVDPEEPVRFNDAKCDPMGRLVAGTMSHISKKEGVHPVKPGAGNIYGVDLDGSIKKLDGGFDLSNGMGWHGNKFYFTETLGKKIFAYDWDSDGFAVSNRQTVVDFAKLEGADKFGIPDGLAVDTDGRLWVACFFGSRILCVDPQVGKVVRQVSLPVANVTSCCFGGENFADLFVTCAGTTGLRPGEALPPEAGSVFRVSGLGARGGPSVHFKGKV